MTLIALAFSLLARQQVVVEMNDGVRDLRVGKTGVRVEVRNRGNGLAEPPPPEPDRRYFSEEELESDRLCDSWD